MFHLLYLLYLFHFSSAWHAHYFSRYAYRADIGPGRQILRETAAISVPQGMKSPYFLTVRTDSLFFVVSVRILQNLPLLSASRKLIFSDLYVLISCFSCFPYVFCRTSPFFLFP